MKISLLQYDIQWMDYQANLDYISNHLKSLESPVDLLVLPEMFLTGFNMDAQSSAIAEDDDIIVQLIDICKTNNTALIGSLAILEGSSFYNRVLLIDGNGIVDRYDKQYTYTPSGETKVFTSRYDTKLLQFNGWSILPQVCYDLRFPEGIRHLNSPDLIIYSANWPTPRITHWDTLLMARAIENQCWVIGCNRVGKDANEWSFPGHSQIVKPDGKVIFLGSVSDSIELELPKETVINYRSKYPFQADKKDLTK